MKTIATAKEVLEDLASKHGKLTPELVLNAAKAKSSPIHGLFCWDDSQAAIKYRLVQASELIRRVKVTIVSNGEPIRVRAYVNVRDGEESLSEQGVYVSISDSIANPSYRDQLLKAARRDAIAFREKYSALAELAGVVAALDEFAV